ncbi:MAG: SAM-dependent methyltransferase [Lachnospiraceae bacterium]|nr:SAM-dependent methyltransferase [Lachnospiraceae bacterium]
MDIKMNEELKELLADTLNEGLYQIIISNARRKEEAFKVKIRPVMLKKELLFQETVYRGTKVFHENYKGTELAARIENYLLNDFKQCEIEHTIEKATVLSSKKGKITVKRKQHAKTPDAAAFKAAFSMEHNRVKNHLLKEGIAVPFLVDLGVQNADGSIVRSKYDKYKQINRFLEFIQDVLPALPTEREIRIVDFGCGKSYLTFAIYYYLHELMGRDISITGLDLKTDVIEKCNQLSRKYGYEKLRFLTGDIAEYDEIDTVDMVVTLHACDTATDYALNKALKWDTKIILSVPCCQHEVNDQIDCEKLQPLLQYGIIKERMSALITDALRADLLKAEGYDVDLLEFIDMEHTPKNILIRAVKKNKTDVIEMQKERDKITDVTEFLKIETTLQKLLSCKDF